MAAGAGMSEDVKCIQRRVVCFSSFSPVFLFFKLVNSTYIDCYIKKRGGSVGYRCYNLRGGEFIGSETHGLIRRHAISLDGSGWWPCRD